MMTPPPPPPAIVAEQPPRWDVQPVKARKVKRHVVRIVANDANVCVLWAGEKPRKRFVNRLANLFATQNGWVPRAQVKKGIRQGFRKACQ